MSIQVDMYPEKALDLYCSDDPPPSPVDYRVTITIENLVLEGPGGQRTKATGPITLTGQAGGNPFG